MSPAKSSPYRPDIDGLRALAVGLVVAFHAFPQIFRAGFIGVDIFFVISGFLITGILIHSETSGFAYLQNFYLRRIRRIFPALALMVTTVSIAAVIFLFPKELKLFGGHLFSANLFSLNFQLLREANYFDSASDLKPLLHLWSLSVEEQFYFAWPLLIYFFRKSPKVCLGLTLGLCGTSFLFCVLPLGRSREAIFYLPYMRFWELLVGAALAVCPWPNELSPRNRNVLSAIGLLLMLIGCGVIKRTQIFPAWNALLPVLGAVAIIAGGPKAWINRKIFSTRAMVAIGLISYPLYLWHWPIFSFLNLTLLEPPASAKIKIGAILLSLILAAGTYHAIELPLRRSAKPWRSTLFFVSLMTGLGGFGLFLKNSEGMKSRFRPEILLLLNYVPDVRVYRYRECLITLGKDAPTFANCRTGPAGADVPAMILWGDSYAAHLYPGLKNGFENRWQITQLTASGCPPILDTKIDGEPECQKTNAKIFARIEQEHPQRVILAGAWLQHPAQWPRLKISIDRLRALGIEPIIVGPVPRWVDGGLALYFAKSCRLHAPICFKNRIWTNSLRMSEKLDLEMTAFAGENQVRYISAYLTFCNANGCLARTSGAPNSLVAHDEGHLTQTGSEYLVERFPEWF